MIETTAVEQFAAAPESARAFHRERLELEITELISELIEEQGISRTELSRRLGTSKPYVTKLLRDGGNMKIRTISDIFFALGRSLRLIARPLSHSTRSLLVGENARPINLANAGADMHFDPFSSMNVGVLPQGNWRGHSMNLSPEPDNHTPRSAA